MSPWHPSQQHGFTLIETLVAMISGVVVTGATFSVLIVSLHQTSRITDSVQSTQFGRTAMTHVIDELHSVCLARKFSPVQENSGESKLIFVNAYSKEAVISKTEAFEHEIKWSGEATQKLTDTVTSASGGQWPNFEFNATPKTTVLAEHITQGKVPIFQYYKYATTASEGSSETPAGALVKMTLPTGGALSATEAAEVAAVQVNLKAVPLDGETALSRSAEFGNLVTFSFSTPSSEAKIEDGPCQ